MTRPRRLVSNVIRVFHLTGDVIPVKRAVACPPPAAPIDNRNPQLLSAVLSSCHWKKLRAAPNEPIYRESNSFVHGRVGSPQPVAHGRKWV